MSADTALVAGRSRERDVDELRAQIVDARLRTRESLQELEVELRVGLTQLTDWRRMYRARPGLFIAAAFAVGFLAGCQGHPSHLEKRR